MLKEQRTFPARFDEIEEICDLVDRAAQIAGFDDSTSYACQLAIGEACENIICHGYKGEDLGEIAVSVCAEAGNLTIEIQDSAPPFDPTTVSTSQNEGEIEDIEGGLGLPIIRKVMDEVQDSQRGSTNRLTLRKRSTSD